MADYEDSFAGLNEYGGLLPITNSSVLRCFYPEEGKTILSELLEEDDRDEDAPRARS